MRKSFLLVLLTFLAVNLFAQTPWAYYPYGGSAAAAYAVPDATCDQLYEIENFKNKGYSGNVAGIPGREIVLFDQVSATAGGSTYAAEYGVTCGASPAGTAASYSNFRTDWGTGTYDPKVGKWNPNPETLEGCVGAYFFHTVNFTQAGDYKFLFRIRGNANATTGVVTNSTVVVTLYSKSNISTPLATKTIKIDGMKYNLKLDGTYGTGLIGNTSTDGSAEYAADGDFLIAANQSRPEWVRGTSAVNIATPGEYVVKISQTVGSATGGIGGFTFQRVADAPILYTNSPLTGFLTVAGAESSSKVLNVAGAMLTGSGDFAVTGSANFEVSTDNTTFGNSVTLPVASVNTLAGVNVYVRVKASASAGSLNENITISADGGTSGATVQCTGTVNVPASYTWNGSVSTDYTVAGNWTPNRTTSLSTDGIIFDGTTSTVTNIPNQTIGQLMVKNGAVVTLSNNTASSNITLSLSGGAGTDLSVEAGSHLILNSNAASTTMNITLNTGATGIIAGQISVMCDEITTGSNHKINSKVDALHFVSGSVFHATTGFASYPFGSSPNGGVVFESGSTYRHSSGDTPFGGTNATNVAVFQAGSYYLFDGNQAGISAKPGVGGKTYDGIFEINTSNGGNVIGNSNPASDCNFNIVKVYGTQWAIGGNTAGAVTYIKGNVTVGTNGLFRFGLNPGVISPVIFNGTSPQTVLLEDNGVFNNGSGSVMTINNNVTFDGNVTINGTLNVNASKSLTIASGKTLNLPSTAVVSVPTDATLSINGAVANAGTMTLNGTVNGTGYVQTNGAGVVTSTVNGDKTFPIGTATTYAPFTFTGNTANDAISAKVSNTLAGPVSLSDKIVQLQWTVVNTTPGANTGTITLQWPASAENGGFDRTNNVVVAFNDVTNPFSSATLLSGTVTGSDPYTITVNCPASLTANDVFVVGNADAFALYTKVADNKLVSFTAYPSVVNSVLKIKSGAVIGNYAILDLSGKTILKGRINKTDGEVNVSGLSQGVYFVKADSDNGSSVAKFKVVR